MVNNLACSNIIIRNMDTIELFNTIIIYFKDKYVQYEKDKSYFICNDSFWNVVEFFNNCVINIQKFYNENNNYNYFDDIFNNISIYEKWLNFLLNDKTNNSKFNVFVSDKGGGKDILISISEFSKNKIQLLSYDEIIYNFINFCNYINYNTELSYSDAKILINNIRNIIVNKKNDLLNIFLDIIDHSKYNYLNDSISDFLTNFYDKFADHTITSYNRYSQKQKITKTIKEIYPIKQYYGYKQQELNKFFNKYLNQLKLSSSEPKKTGYLLDKAAKCNKIKINHISEKEILYIY